jgi:nucleoside-diphosphate-sugar epimerase
LTPNRGAHNNCTHIEPPSTPQKNLHRRSRRLRRLERRDVKNMLPDISKIETLGWKPKHNIEPAIAKIVKEHAFYLYFLNYPLSC